MIKKCYYLKILIPPDSQVLIFKNEQFPKFGEYVSTKQAYIISFQNQSSLEILNFGAIFLIFTKIDNFANFQQACPIL